MERDRWINVERKKEIGKERGVLTSKIVSNIS